jgi:penicillin V acylase-like amidase (Ntn superfamily)
MDVGEGEGMNSNMWVQPPGMQRDGRGGKNTVSWNRNSAVRS